MKSIQLVELARLLGHPELVSQGAQLEARVDQLEKRLDSTSTDANQVEVFCLCLEVREARQEVYDFLASLGGCITSRAFDDTPPIKRSIVN